MLAHQKRRAPPAPATHAPEHLSLLLAALVGALLDRLLVKVCGIRNWKNACAALWLANVSERPAVLWRTSVPSFSCVRPC
jgi:hypothetical protein